MILSKSVCYRLALCSLFLFGLLPLTRFIYTLLCKQSEQSEIQTLNNAR